MIKGIGVHIKVANFEASKNFYEVLGFRQVFEYGPGTKVPEAYRGMTFEHGGCKLEIAEGHRAVKPEVFKTKIVNSKISLMIPVDSVTEIVELCQKNGIEVAVGPRHYYWGTIEVVVKDPDGVVLVFIQPYDEDVAKKMRADETFGKVPSA